jgi:hypothetical protein
MEMQEEGVEDRQKPTPAQLQTIRMERAVIITEQQPMTSLGSTKVSP